MWHQTTAGLEQHTVQGPARLPPFARISPFAATRTFWWLPEGARPPRTASVSSSHCIQKTTITTACGTGSRSFTAAVSCWWATCSSASPQSPHGSVRGCHDAGAAALVLMPRSPPQPQAQRRPLTLCTRTESQVLLLVAQCGSRRFQTRPHASSTTPQIVPRELGFVSWTAS